jgi:hypothetical protein
VQARQDQRGLSRKTESKTVIRERGAGKRGAPSPTSMQSGYLFVQWITESNRTAGVAITQSHEVTQLCAKPLLAARTHAM